MQDLMSPRGHRYLADCMWTDAPAAQLTPVLAPTFGGLPTRAVVRHLVRLGAAPRRAARHGVLARGQCVLRDVHDLGRRRPTTPRCSAGSTSRCSRWETVSEGVYLGDTDLRRRPDRFMSDENFARLADVARAPRPRRPVLLLPPARRRHPEPKGPAMTLPERSPLTVLPGEPRPYVLRSGDGRAHLLIDQVGRVIVGAEESRGALSYTVLDGPKGGPIPFHFHAAEHDFFFCHRGQVQVWAGEQSRILNPGDFASVPPTVPHAYQLHGHYSGFTGPITPGGWDRFFDFCGIPYVGPGYPVDFQPVLPLDKFFEAQEKFNDDLRARARVGAGDDGTRRRAARRVRAVLPARGGGHAPHAGWSAPDRGLRRRRVGRQRLDGDARAVQGRGAAGPRPRAHTRGDAGARRSARADRSRARPRCSRAATPRASRPGTEHGYTGAAHYTKVLARARPGASRRS